LTIFDLILVSKGRNISSEILIIVIILAYHSGSLEKSGANQLNRDLQFFGQTELKYRKVSSINLDILTKEARYAAGLLDGEGSFVLREIGKTYPRFSPLIELAMTHKETVEFAARVFCVSTDKLIREKPNKDVYYLRITTIDEIKQVCEALLFYSITKKKQIQILLDYFSLKEKLIHPINKQILQNKEILQKMIDLFIELKKLNERGTPPDYDSMKQELLSRLPAN